MIRPVSGRRIGRQRGQRPPARSARGRDWPFPRYERIACSKSLSDRLSGVLDKLTRRGSLTDSDVAEAMREVRRALLEADVALEVVRDFTEKVKAKAVGARTWSSRSRPARWWSRSCTTSWWRCWARTPQPIDLAAQPPVAIMMVGLQGSGKTTTTAKIAYRLTNRDKKKVLMASLDTRRPAAQEQLRVLGEQTNVETLPIIAGQTPQQIARRSIDAARLGGYDVVLLDTAGRLHIDEALMQESVEVRDIAAPHETLAGRRQPHRPGRGEARHQLQRARRHHRHRLDPRRRRRPRRRGALACARSPASRSS